MTSTVPRYCPDCGHPTAYADPVKGCHHETNTEPRCGCMTDVDPPSLPTCATCPSYSQLVSDKAGECRYNPAIYNTPAIGSWPIVEPSAWCSKHPDRQAMQIDRILVDLGPKMRSAMEAAMGDPKPRSRTRAMCYEHRDDAALWLLEDPANRAIRAAIGGECIFCSLSEEEATPPDQTAGTYEARPMVVVTPADYIGRTLAFPKTKTPRNLWRWEHEGRIGKWIRADEHEPSLDLLIAWLGEIDPACACDRCLSILGLVSP